MKVVHIAGMVCQIGPLMRQRCAWCGEVLIDYDLSRMASTGDFEIHGWAPGALVEVEGNCSMVLQHQDGTRLPDHACDKGHRGPPPS